MTVTFDPSTDFASVVDGLEAVTLEVQGRADEAITHAHRNEHRRGEADPAGGQVLAKVTVWQWPTSQSERPPLGSVLVDANGERYTIVGLADQVLGAKYSAECRRLSVEAGLDAYVDLEQASYAKSTAGEAVATWLPVVTGLRAKVQLAEQANEVEHGADETEERYAIYLEKDPPASLLAVIGADVRVRDSAGNTYRVENYQRPVRIDALPLLECLKV